MKKSKIKKHVLICLSHKINKNGELYSDYKKRIKKVFEISEKNPDQVILFTGGSFTNSRKGELSRQAKNYFKSKFVIKKNKKIILENQALDTVGEIIFSRLIIEKERFSRINLVTSDWHLHRVKKIIRKVYGSLNNFDFFTINGSRREVEKEKNNDSFQKFNLWANNCKNGDLECLRNNLLKFHKLY